MTGATGRSGHGNDVRATRPAAITTARLPRASFREKSHTARMLASPEVMRQQLQRGGNIHRERDDAEDTHQVGFRRALLNHPLDRGCQHAHAQPRNNP